MLGIPPTLYHAITQYILLQLFLTNFHQIHRMILSSLVIFQFGIIEFSCFFLGVLFCGLDVLGNEFNEIVCELFVCMAYLLFSQEVLYILDQIFADPALQFFTGFANIVLILNFGSKNPVFLSLTQQLAQSRDILLKPNIITPIFLNILDLFLQFLHLSILGITLFLIHLNLLLIVLDLSLQEFFINFLRLYTFIDILYIFLHAGVLNFLLNNLIFQINNIILILANLLLQNLNILLQPNILHPQLTNLLIFLAKIGHTLRQFLPNSNILILITLPLIFNHHGRIINIVRLRQYMFLPVLLHP